jgi:formylglycine-generating enzyme required for sulfatase activity
MIANQALALQHGRVADRGALSMPAASQFVLCDRCGRSVVVALSHLHPPCFQRVEEQIECPEIQERRGKGEGGLLLMMCGALKRSLEASCGSAEVEAAAHDRRWQVVCRIPGASSAHYSPAEARSRAAIWAAQGQTKLAVALRTAATKAERREPGRMRAIIGLGAMVAVAAGGWFLLVRAPARVPMQTPSLAQQPVETDDAIRSAAATPQSVPEPAMTPGAPSPDGVAPATRHLAPAGQPPAPDESRVARQAPAPEAAPAAAAPAASMPMADAAPAAAEAAPVSDPEFHVPDMVPIPGGAFAMGGTGDASELPIHQISIKPFALGKFPVTVREWKECVAAKACAYLPSGPDDAPVTNLSYNDTQEYLVWLSQVAQKKFRLPSEAEWEYAARAGTKTKYWWGDQMRAGMANCKGCNETYDPSQPMKVGSFQANPFGLFDMGGGVGQWVADGWHKNYQGAPVDGSAWVDNEGFARVMRSGSWKNDPSYVRAASRDRYDARVRYPTHGFRVALSP